MKKSQSRSKLTLNTETVLHLREIARFDLREVQGGKPQSATAADICPVTSHVGGC